MNRRTGSGHRQQATINAEWFSTDSTRTLRHKANTSTPINLLASATNGGSEFIAEVTMVPLPDTMMCHYIWKTCRDTEEAQLSTS
mmetsp:Transcript_34310/g.82069  ORF Transcript_34310/g.82069 Transcript_34310/m.82069 type:complete len:85 (+) Transcript_34310:184-438(+)